MNQFRKYELFSNKSYLQSSFFLDLSYNFHIFYFSKSGLFHKVQEIYDRGRADVEGALERLLKWRSE